ncbi:MAG: NAD-dependent epimerase/dehydratase family protein [Thermoleophilaceae bacterium]|nr:NAD-dependent epimerase/dehydratase family protein [Thermoleophilaceae bacterium]
MRVCVTGATGFIGGHVARLLAERGDEVRATYRDAHRMEGLAALGVEPVKADILDRGAMRRAVRRCELVFHVAGFVGANPVARVWDVNALGPRVVVEAAAAEDAGRVVVTSSVSAIGPVAPGEVGTEEDPYRGGGLGLTYVDSKHEGEVEALAAGVRTGIEVVAVNPSYVLGVPVDASRPGETSTRVIGNYLRGRLPGVVDGQANIVDVRDVAAGHLKAADRGRPGERYVLGGHDVGWVELLERVGELAGVNHPLVILPPEVGSLSRRAEALRIPMAISAEGLVLMGQNWRYSSRKARRELGYRARRLDTTLRETIHWYRGLIDSGALAGGRHSTLSVAASGMRLADRLGLLAGLPAFERHTGRRLMTRR